MLMLMTLRIDLSLKQRGMEQTPGCSSSGGATHSTAATAKPSTSQQTDIPEGLYDLLKGVTIAVLRDRPTDLCSFVADYFTKVRQ